jgi:hypothetical protein
MDGVVAADHHVANKDHSAGILTYTVSLLVTTRFLLLAASKTLALIC